MSNIYIILAVVVIVVSLIFRGIMKKSVKDEIVENNDFIKKFRDIAKDDPYILYVLRESRCDEKSLQLESPTTFKESKRYLKMINKAKNEFIRILDMPCIKFMDVNEQIETYIWCKGHGKRDCSICCKNKMPLDNPLLWNPQGHLDSGISDPFGNPYL